jgi:hypothetical protein
MDIRKVWIAALVSITAMMLTGSCFTLLSNYRAKSSYIAEYRRLNKNNPVLITEAGRSRLRDIDTGQVERHGARYPPDGAGQGDCRGAAGKVVPDAVPNQRLKDYGGAVLGSG